MKNTNKLMKKTLLLIIATLLLKNITSYAASLELEWVVKDDSNIKEYSLSYGNVLTGVTTTVKLGKINSVKIETLSEGTTYWFQIIPIGIHGEHGVDSNILYYKVPVVKYEETREKPTLRIKPKVVKK